MRLEWKFKRLTNFIDSLPHEIDSALMTATQNIARVLHKHLIQRTPVKTGNLRKMWSAGDNLSFTVERAYGGYQVTLINTARRDDEDGYMYGVAVNDGHNKPNGGGWVQGRFFVQNSIHITQEQVEQIVMKELQKHWRSTK